MEKIQVLQQHQERLRSLNQQQYQDFKKKMELINQIQIETRSRLNEGEIPEKISEENEKINHDDIKEKYKPFYYNPIENYSPLWLNYTPTPFGQKIDFSNIHLRRSGSPVSYLDIAKSEYTESQKNYELQVATQNNLPYLRLPYPRSPDPYLYYGDPLTNKLKHAFREKVNIQDQLSRLKHVSPETINEPSNQSINDLNIEEINLLESPPTDNVVVTDPYEIFPIGMSFMTIDSELMDLY